MRWVNGYRFELRQDGVAKESVFAIGTYASPPLPEYSLQLQVDQQATQCAGEDDRHGAPALGLLPMPAPRINDSAMARPAAQDGMPNTSPTSRRHQSSSKVPFKEALPPIPA